MTDYLLVKLPISNDKRFDTISVSEAHNDVVNRFGSVWFGKAGRGFSSKILDQLRLSLREKKKVCLIILCGNRRERAFFISTIKAIATARCPDERKIPSYYRGMMSFIKQWVEVGEFRKMTEEELTQYSVVSSGRLMTEVAPICQAPYMMIRKT